MISNVDYYSLKNALLEAIKVSFVFIRSNIGSENLYTFGLYTSGEANYIRATANTEEALARRAIKYAAEIKKPFNDCKILLRWNPGDWEYHGASDKCFSRVQELLNKAWTEDFSEFIIDRTLVYKISLDALRESRDNGVFSDDSGATTILLNLFTGDSDINILLDQARVLNDNVTFNLFRSDLQKQEQVLNRMS